MKRIAMYVFAVFIFALGVAFSIKSDLGVSPVSSVPFVMSLIINKSVGFITAVLFIGFVAIQWFLLKKEFEIRELTQLAFAVVFGFFVDMSLFLISDITKGGIIKQYYHLILGTFLIALGIYLMLKANITISPGDGLVRAMSIKSKFRFTRVKIGFDLFCAFFSGVVSFLFLHKIAGVGIGTVLCALGVGTMMDLIDKAIGKKVAVFISGGVKKI